MYVWSTPAGSVQSVQSVLLALQCWYRCICVVDHSQSLLCVRSGAVRWPPCLA
jgi:hypothetical protein